MDNFRDILLADDKAKHETIPVVISSRIRLARNLSGYRFVKYACRDDLRKVADKCEDTLKKYFLFKDKGAFSIKSLLDYEKCALVEHHLCSQELIQDFNESRLVLSGDNMTSIMMNEEDHLRLQVFGSDLDFKAMFDEMPFVPFIPTHRISFEGNKKYDKDLMDDIFEGAFWQKLAWRIKKEDVDPDTILGFVVYNDLDYILKSSPR